MELGALSLKREQQMRCDEKHFRVLTVGHLGSGLGGKLGCEANGIADREADVIGLPDALGLERARVNGSSMAGAVARHLAIHLRKSA